LSLLAWHAHAYGGLGDASPLAWYDTIIPLKNQIAIPFFIFFDFFAMFYILHKNGFIFWLVFVHFAQLYAGLVFSQKYEGGGTFGKKVVKNTNRG
jgi:hypothetical protein